MSTDRPATVLGWSREELIGMHPREFDGTGRTIDSAPRAARPRGEIITFETRHRRKDGTTFPVEVRTGTFQQGGKLFLPGACARHQRAQARRRISTAERSLPDRSATAEPYRELGIRRGKQPYVYTSEESDRLFGVDPQGENRLRTSSSNESTPRTAAAGSAIWRNRSAKR